MTMDSSLFNLSVEDLDRFKTIVEEIRSKKTSSKNSVDSFMAEYSTYAELNYSKKYVQSIKLSLKYLGRFFPDTNLEEIAVKDAEDFLAFLKNKAPKGFRVYFRNLKAAFNKAVDWEYIKSNPFSRLRFGKVQTEQPSYIGVEELDRILSFTDNPTHRDIFLFAFYTGCRLSEIVYLRWRNIDLQRKHIVVGDAEFTTKTRETRVIPVCERLHTALSKRFESSRKDQNGYVFAKLNGFSFTPDYISRKFKSIVRKADLSEKIHFHSLRHSFASLLIQNRTNLYTVKELLGHKSVKTTEIYSHLSIEHLETAMEVFNDVA